MDYQMDYLPKWGMNVHDYSDYSELAVIWCNLDVKTSFSKVW